MRKTGPVLSFSLLLERIPSTPKVPKEVTPTVGRGPGRVEGLVILLAGQVGEGSLRERCGPPLVGPGVGDTKEPPLVPCSFSSPRETTRVPPLSVETPVLRLVEVSQVEANRVPVPPETPGK